MPYPIEDVELDEFGNPKPKTFDTTAPSQLPQLPGLLGAKPNVDSIRPLPWISNELAPALPAPKPAPTDIPALAYQRQLSPVEIRDQKAANLAALQENRPVADKPKWWAYPSAVLSMLAGGAAGYMNSTGKFRQQFDPQAAAEGFMAPVTAPYQRKLMDWTFKKEAAKTALDEANKGVENWSRDRQLAIQEENLASEKAYRDAQIKSLESKSAKDDYITVPGGGLWNAAEKKWERSPVDRAQMMEVSGAWAKSNMPALRPDENGKYWLPVGAAGALVRADNPTNPEKWSDPSGQLWERQRDGSWKIVVHGTPKPPDELTDC